MTVPISALIQNPTVEPDVELFMLDAAPLGGSALYFTEQADNGQPVSFGGISYTPIRVAFEGMEVSGQGVLPSPTIHVYNDAADIIRGIANEIGSLEGCTVRRIRTFRCYLDGQATPDGNSYHGPDVFVIDRKVEDTADGIKWQLVAAIDQDGRLVPKRRALRDVCLHRYRIWTGTAFDYSKAQCPYVGAVYYDRTDAVTTNPANDVCSRHVPACKLRFGANSPLPFGGFPGIARVQA